MTATATHTCDVSRDLDVNVNVNLNATVDVDVDLIKSSSVNDHVQGGVYVHVQVSRSITNFLVDPAGS